MILRILTNDINKPNIYENITHFGESENYFNFVQGNNLYSIPHNTIISIKITFDESEREEVLRGFSHL